MHPFMPIFFRLDLRRIPRCLKMLLIHSHPRCFCGRRELGNQSRILTADQMLELTQHTEQNYTQIFESTCVLRKAFSAEELRDQRFVPNVLYPVLC